MLEKDLKDATLRYWEHIRDRHGNRMAPAMTEYVGHKQPDLANKSLLRAELDWAGSKPGHLPQERRQATLVLLVGYSPEPLLQSICAYQPKRVLLVLSKSSDGAGNDEKSKQYGEDLWEAIDLLVKHGFLAARPEMFHPNRALPGIFVPSKPADVFAALVEVLRGEKSDEASDEVLRDEVLIDITGGKKSMVTGAFLYATFANAPITYVDFEDYDPSARRPYGYTCIIGEIDNPYRMFSLRDWERVRTLYQTYRFEEARGLLDGSVAPVFGAYLKEAKGALSKLQSVLRCCAAWENGDYSLAWKIAQQITPGDLPTFAPPTAVTEFGLDWTKVTPTKADDLQLVVGQKGLYGKERTLPVYIADELARTRRTIRCNHDYRTGFLRAGSLNEVIMLARLVRMADANDRQALLDALDENTPAAKNVFGELFNKRLLDKITIGRSRNKVDIWFPGAPEITITVSTSLSRWWKGLTIFGDEANGWDQFITTRNNLTHKYSSVPADWAEAAYTFVERNAADFLEQIDYDKTVVTQVWNWQTLCRETKIAQWLPPNLSQGEEKNCDESLPAGR